MNDPVLVATRMEGFKCFQSLKLSFGALTLVTGFNGGGKSTALQPLLLLAQAMRLGNTDRLPLNGPLISLGTAGDIGSGASGREVVLEVEGANETLLCRPSLRAGERVLPLTEALIRSDFGAALSTLGYIGAVRMGAEDSFPIPERSDTPDMGHDGRFAPFWFDRLVDEDVEAARRCPDVTAVTFRKQLDAWLGRLFPGAAANVQYAATVSRMHLQFRLSALGDWRRPSNIGYGLTYVFPILVALLAATPGQVIVIDSPESHLHPSAQSAMGRILASFAAAGVQLIVETHSDHLLNGVRLALQERLLSHEAVRIYFFKGSVDGDHGVTSPRVGPHGEIYEWPDGFFDQSEKDLSRLAGWS